MALLAEEIVEEWLNRQGFFTIRGIKIGVQEMDILAVKNNNGNLECRHIEVQASIRPVTYVTKVPKELQKLTGRASGSAKQRTPEELKHAVEEWVQNKFLMEKKHHLRESLVAGIWTYELVVHRVQHPEELELIQKQGVKVYMLSNVIKELREESGNQVVPAASGADFVNLVLLES